LILVFIIIVVVTVCYGRVEAIATDSGIEEMLVGFVVSCAYREEGSIMYWLSPEFDVHSWWKNSIHDKVVVFTVEPLTTGFMINGIATITSGA